MNEEDAKAIKKSGRESRQAGKALTDNPYLQPDALPKATGEDEKAWEQKQYLWMQGWFSADS